jgi:hypothetical protein
MRDDFQGSVLRQISLDFILGRVVWPVLPLGVDQVCFIHVSIQMTVDCDWDLVT